MSLPFALVVCDASRSDEVARPAQSRREDGFQPARHRRQGDIAFVCRALALQQVDVEFPVQTEAELNAKGRCRGFVLGGCRPAQEDRPIAGL
jgi:hypothetical protein